MGTVKICVLVVRPWTSDLDSVAATLGAVALDAELTRVDFEAALRAALVRQRFDAIVYDAATTSLPRDAVEAAVRDRALILPVVELQPIDSLGERVAAAITRARS
jgi:hypothetical protein